MSRLLRSARTIVCFVIPVMAFCNAGHAQQQTEASRTDRDDNRQKATRRAPEVSDLTKENLKHVTASAGQIREILLKDAGLFVELKRWVAKDAADNGQVVFDRLE